eukprot:scaffold6849_cov157-Skeletonema_marinoi.AAC.6
MRRRCVANWSAEVEELSPTTYQCLLHVRSCCIDLRFVAIFELRCVCRVQLRMTPNKGERAKLGR